MLITDYAVKTLMLFDQHRKFAGYDVSPEVLGAAEPDFGVTFPSQMLNQNQILAGGVKWKQQLSVSQTSGVHFWLGK